MKSIIPWRWGKRKGTRTAIRDEFGIFWEDPMDFSFPFRAHRAAPVAPAVNISKSDKEISVRAELPGLAEKDLEVSCFEGVLTIRGEKKAEKEDKQKGSLYKECHFGSFCRQVPIDDNVDWSKVSARYKKGVLTVSIPKKPDEKNKTVIEIK